MFFTKRTKYFPKCVIAAIVLAASTSIGNGAVAADVPTSLEVSAEVTDACTISAAPMSFGNYNFAVVRAQSEITVKCTNGTAYEIDLDQGTGSGATVTTRKMTGPAGNTLNYFLYSDSQETYNWGEDTTGPGGQGSGVNQTFPVYGVIPADQASPVGNYSDTVTATVDFNT